MSFDKFQGIHIFLMKAGQKDDLLRISCDPHSDGYLVELTQHMVGNSSSVVMRYMSDVTRYLDKFIDFLLIDVHHYDSYQLDVPSFPVVVVKHDALCWSRGLLHDSIRDLKHDWPHECRLPK